MVNFKNPHYDKELEDYINSHPMFCKENTGSCVCKSDFYHYIYSFNILDTDFVDIDYAFWIARSLKFIDNNDKPIEITWERTNEFFTRIESYWKKFHGSPSGFIQQNPNNIVMLTDDEDFVI